MGIPVLSFNGSASPDQYATCPLPGSGTFGGICGISMAVYFPTMPISGTDYLFSGQNAGLLGSHAVNVGVTGNARGQMVQNGIQQASQATASFTAGVWRRVVLVGNSASSNSQLLYVIYPNGTVVTDTVVTNDDPYNALVNLILGKRIAPVGGVSWDAGQDGTFYGCDVRVLTTVPSQASLVADAWVRQVGNEAGLGRYWKCNEGTGTSLTELVAGATGTLTNVSWITVASPFPTVPSNPGTPSVTLPVGNTLTFSWTASTDENDDAITYDTAISFDNGSTWTTLTTGQSAANYSGSTSSYSHTRFAKVRVRTTAGTDTTAWVESSSFVIWKRVLRMEYEVGQMRVDRGLLVDKGNFGINPAHPDFAAGAVGDGLHDDYAALYAANAFAVSLGAPLILPPDRVFLCNTELAITAFVEGLGGQIRPASGITVTLSGGYRTCMEAIGDTSVGGTITISRPTSPVLGQTHNDVSSNKIIWYNGSVWKDGAGTTVA